MIRPGSSSEPLRKISLATTLAPLLASIACLSPFFSPASEVEVIGVTDAPGTGPSSVTSPVSAPIPTDVPIVIAPPRVATATVLLPIVIPAVLGDAGVPAERHLEAIEQLVQMQVIPEAVTATAEIRALSINVGALPVLYAGLYVVLRPLLVHPNESTLWLEVL